MILKNNQKKPKERLEQETKSKKRLRHDKDDNEENLEGDENTQEMDSEIPSSKLIIK